MRWTKVLIALAVCLVSAVLVAQQRVHQNRILHEYFDGEVAPSSGGEGAGEASSDMPTAPPLPAVAQSTGELQPPPLSGEVGRDELVWGAEGPSPDARLEEPNGPLNPFGSSHSLDTRTDRVDELNYFENFDPSIIPFKRVVALNRFRHVRGAYSVELESGRKVQVSSGNLLRDDEEVFWGTFAINALPNQWLPIASVAPDQRILRLESEPPVPLEIHRDIAGNHFVMTQHRGLLRLNMQVAVRTDYFAGEFPDVSWGEFDGLVDFEHPEVSGVVQGVLRDIGVSKRQSPREVLLTLIEYFRDFEGRAFPEDVATDDLFKAIVDTQVGVCRHRSLAFLVALRALGIPVHYVYNEAHAFVEIYWPRLGWRRVDLGGAADELNSASNQASSIHQPPDSLPQPQRFLDEQERMASNTEGGPSEGGGSGEGSGENSESSENSETVETAEGTEGSANVEGSELSETAEVNDVTAEGEPVEEPPKRIATRLTLSATQTSIRRGEELVLSGRLSAADNRLMANKVVEIHVAPLGQVNPSARTLVDQASTDLNGRYSSRTVLPPDFAVGRWTLFVHYKGDEELDASSAE
ncbi:transglutaminase-like domain-containing protein [Microvenator marinus]|nr:transglutaminase domain-containing protein [Microvenator marinus]